MECDMRHQKPRWLRPRYAYKFSEQLKPSFAAVNTIRKRRNQERRKVRSIERGAGREGAFGGSRRGMEGVYFVNVQLTRAESEQVSERNFGHKGIFINYCAQSVWISTQIICISATKLSEYAAKRTMAEKKTTNKQFLHSKLYIYSINSKATRGGLPLEFT